MSALRLYDRFSLHTNVSNLWQKDANRSTDLKKTAFNKTRNRFLILLKGFHYSSLAYRSCSSVNVCGCFCDKTDDFSSLFLRQLDLWTLKQLRIVFEEECLLGMAFKHRPLLRNPLAAEKVFLDVQASTRA